MNSENTESLEEELVSLDELICRRFHFPRLNSNSTVGLAKATVSLLTSLSALKSFESLLLLAVRGFGNFPNLSFSEECVKIIHIPIKEGGIDLFGVHFGYPN